MKCHFVDQQRLIPIRQKCNTCTTKVFECFVVIQKVNFAHSLRVNNGDK